MHFYLADWMSYDLRHMPAVYYKALVSHVHIHILTHNYILVWDMPAGIPWTLPSAAILKQSTSDRYLSHNFQRSTARVTLSHEMGIYLLQRNLIGALVLNCPRRLTNWYHRSIAIPESLLLHVLFIGRHRSLFLFPLRHFFMISKELLSKRTSM